MAAGGDSGADGVASDESTGVEVALFEGLFVLDEFLRRGGGSEFGVCCVISSERGTVIR
jgi:hypothetical protein